MKRKRSMPDGYVDLDVVNVRDRKGRRVDQGYVDRVVKAADDVRPVGRPGLTSGPGPAPQIAVRLPTETYQRVQRLAKERGISAAALAREALEEFLGKAG